MRKLLIPALSVLALGVALAARPLAHAQSGGQTDNDLGSLWNAAAPVASGSLFATNLTTAYKASVLRMCVVLKVTGVLYISETDGTTTQVYALNGGTALTAFQAYTFVWEARRYSTDGTTRLTYNFQLGTSTTGGVAAFRVTELSGVD